MCSICPVSIAEFEDLVTEPRGAVSSVSSPQQLPMGKDPACQLRPLGVPSPSLASRTKHWSTTCFPPILRDVLLTQALFTELWDCW